MEMTLTVHVPRRRPHPVDVVVEWSGRSTVADLCAAIADHLGEPVPALVARGEVLRPDAAVGMPPLVHGASVAVTPAAGTPATSSNGYSAPVAVLDLVVVGGPDAGRSHPLTPPGVAVGRAPTAGLTVGDDALSRSHAFVRVGAAGVTVADCDSTNGITVNGSRVRTETAIDARSTVVLGASTLRLRRAGGPGPPARHPGDGTVLISRSARPMPETGSVEIACPPAPPERHRVRVPWVAGLAPVPVAIGLALFLGPQLLVFAALGPVSLLAGALGDRWGSGRTHRRELAAHAAAVEGAHLRLAEALCSERERLDREHPDPGAVLTTAEQRLAGLWQARASSRVRLGLGVVPTRVAWLDGSARTNPAVAHAPLVVDLAEVRCLGVLGSPDVTDAFLAGLVGQLCTANAPHDLRVSVALSASVHPQWSWVARLPHHDDRASPSPQDPLARRAPDPVGAERGGRGALRLMVVPRAGPDLTGVAQRVLDDGGLVVVGASSRADLPSGCGGVVHRVESSYVLDGPAGRQCFVPDLVGPWWLDRLSRALAPVRCTDPVPTRRMPPRLTLLDALGGAEITPAGVAERWRARTDAAGRSPTPAAAVGWGPDGPHVLVGGTTGSGKSEFLRTLVTSLAISTPPEELIFVLVDFKGGAAFGGCAALPHVVGLVTDLDDHLVSRALSSLRAELRRRERLFATVGAGDLEAYQRLRDAGSEPVPRLVVVVDELRALVDELPEFVTGLVRLAALGRSLGVHLVLATQRPSGVVSAEIQANVSLRIAFRVRDRADSLDVLDDAAASDIAPSTPGRALARGADGALVTFQAATVWAAAVRGGRGLRVRSPDKVGAKTFAAIDEHETAGTDTPSPLVETVRAAHRLVGGHQPRAPWLAPLPALVGPAPGAPSDARFDGRPVVGLVDEPDLQRITALYWEPADGPWRLVGAGGTGRTTALRALVLAAAARSAPGALHVHVIDAHGSLADLRDLPHLGTRAAHDDPRACSALVRHLRAVVDRRLGAPAPPPSSAASPARPTTLLVVDGWDQLAEAQSSLGPDPLTAELLRVLRDGRSVGVVGAVSGGRSLLHPRWAETAGCTFLLGSIDPLDAALAGLSAGDVPRDPPAGRAVRAQDRREVQFVAATEEHSSAVAAGAGPRPRNGDAWRWRALPELVRRREVPDGSGTCAGGLDPAPDGVLLGIAGEDGVGYRWSPGRRRPPAPHCRTVPVRADEYAAGGRRIPLRKGVSSQ